ncbi:class I SAM-dependent methyltransferase [Amycolatopsis sp.]|jgi:SAM-dependent methyltransferase|uniref:class I SAM-dependent methyltransferase n=1 Tax=Amycolatopsis sp. TaxID=37632 RepID=UPI002E04FB1A|nr:class I SAM-dependent methyltransferase [Amycolatopsis sp.]
MFDEQSWEERYREKTAVWSGQPNQQLVDEASDLPVGTALDVGCGEGGDTLWLASRGWKVTAVDFSTVALNRAAGHLGDLAEGVEWVHADLTKWTPSAGHFDLVTAQFMHLPTADREPLFARLADSVAPGGTLLIVGHCMNDLHVAAHRPPDMFFTADEVAKSLDPGQWEIVVAEERRRPAHPHEGENIHVADAILRARRR